MSIVIDNLIAQVVGYAVLPSLHEVDIKIYIHN